MSGPTLTRRGFLLALLGALGACAAPAPPPVVTATDPDPDPEQVYTPGPISWANLTEEHKRRARAALTRLGEDIPDDETLQARWLIMSPAQQRFMIRRPPPPPPPPRRTARGGRSRGRAPARTSGRATTRQAAPAASGSRQRRRR